MPHFLLPVTILSAIGFALACPAAAQQILAPTAPRVAAGACGADSMYTRVPVYLRVTVARSADTVAAPSLLLIAQAVAGRIRTALGASLDSVPRGDAVVASADSVGLGGGPLMSGVMGGLDSAGLRAVARRDGSLRWSRVRTESLATTTLLDRALADTKQADEAFILPDQFSADSMAFTLDYVRPMDVVDGRVRPRTYGPSSLVAFTVRTAVERLAATVPGTIQMHYPESARSSGAEAHVQLSFVVDTTGRAIASTVHDVWPKDRPRLTGELGNYYERFVRGATEAVVRGRFYPAEIAGCKVKQLVQLPVTWTITR